MGNYIEYIIKNISEWERMIYLSKLQPVSDPLWWICVVHLWTNCHFVVYYMQFPGLLVSLSSITWHWVCEYTCTRRVTSHVDYCNTMLAGSPMSTSNRHPVGAECGSSCRQWYWDVRQWPDAVTSLWTALAGRYSISLEWPSTIVFKAGRQSTLWTAVHLIRMLPAVSVFTLSATTSSSFHDIIAASLVVEHDLLSAWWAGTVCLTISMTHCLVMRSSEQQWKHTFLQVLERGRSALEASSVIAFHKCTITNLLTYLLGN